MDSPVPILSFPSPAAFRAWLARHHRTSGGIWLRFFKKDSGRVSITYPEALDEALCVGWIDGQLKPGDADSWLRTFTPRRPGGLWSARNLAHVKRLTAAGRMRPAGLAQVAAARADGRARRAYAPASTMTVPRDFLAAVGRNARAARTFRELDRANLYAIAWRLRTAKQPATRARRMTAILELLARGRTLHPRRR